MTTKRVKNQYWLVNTSAVCYDCLEPLPLGTKAVKLTFESQELDDGKKFIVILATFHMECAKDLGADMAIESARP